MSNLNLKLEDAIYDRSSGPDGIARTQEDTRSLIALGSIALLAVVVVCAMIYILSAAPFESEVFDSILKLISIISGVIGVVIGFYFGQKSK